MNNPVLSAPILTTSQLCLLRCLVRRGFGAELLDIFLCRCGATRAEYQALSDLGYVLHTYDMITMTDLGQRVYRRARVGRYF